jgi:hypothetical protein
MAIFMRLTIRVLYWSGKTDDTIQVKRKLIKEKFMISNKLKFAFFISFLFANPLLAQDITPYQFGKITAADFNLPQMSFDSGANAVVISDIGITRFEGNDHGYFNLVFTHYMRVKVLNKNGFDIGEKLILLYHDLQGESEKLYSVKGSTFNLENGLIQETKLDVKSIFTEKYNENYDEKKFALPALKDGSVFDLEYTVKSPFSDHLRSWSFQGKYPRLWSEYVVTIPPPLHYVMRMQGDQHFDIDTKKDVLMHYNIVEKRGAGMTDDMYNVSGMAVSKRWAKKNVPAMNEELYTTTIDNYISKVAFQLKYVQWNNEDKHEEMIDWNSAARELMDREDFGHALNHENNWMSDELKGIVNDASSDEDKARKIFAFVRDNFRAIDKDGYSRNNLFVDNSLKDVYRKREGNVAEVNLLLMAMLRKADINAEPLILSTRDNGIADSSYPLITEYNYVICIAYPGNKIVTLDASDPFNGYGQLPVRCYNGWGHIINANKPLAMEFSADSVWERSFTSVRIFNDDKNKWAGTLNTVFGKSESNRTRGKIVSTSEKAYKKEIETEHQADLDIANFGIDSLRKCDFPLSVHYDFDLKNISSEIVYFNPMLVDAFQNNPFKSINRHYPVEMPFKIDRTYVLNMEIPAGYQVDEMPKSARVAYNENEGMFEYMIQKGEDNIQMRVRLKLNKAFFPTDEYTALRDFFAYVVKKESEQIVFKKVK